MQQNPNYPPNPNFVNQDPQSPQGNPSNQTFINSSPGNNMPQNNTPESNGGFKIAQLVWFVVGFINVLLTLRIVFLLFSARSSGFTGFLYNITSPFTLPFVGIFPVPGQVDTFFDTAALVAIIIYSLIAWGIVTLINIISNNQRSS